MRNDEALAQAEEELKLLEPGSTAYRVAEARFVGLQKAVKEERGKTVEVPNLCGHPKALYGVPYHRGQKKDKFHPIAVFNVQGRQPNANLNPAMQIVKAEPDIQELWDQARLPGTQLQLLIECKKQKPPIDTQQQRQQHAVPTSTGNDKKRKRQSAQEDYARARNQGGPNQLGR